MDPTTRDHAVEQAYRDHAPDVYRVAYGVLRDRDEALDATHDAFARAWERWDQYDAQRPLRGWLHGIVVHVALDHLRRRRVRQVALPLLRGRAVTELHAGSAADHAPEVVQRRVVDEVLATLRPQARAALILRHYYGYDYAEIGAFLGLRSGSVGSTLARAHEQLRQRLVAHGDSPVDERGQPTDHARDRSLPARATDRPDPPEVLP